MAEVIEFDPVDTISAGAFGRPGARTFVIQARKGSARLSVLVEKEQVALLAAEARQFLDRIDEEDPEPGGAEPVPGGPVEEDEPLFRARLIGLGYDPQRRLVLIELREAAASGDDDDEEAAPPPARGGEEAPGGAGRVARLFATRAQVRAMAAHGAAAVAAGRPRCPLCEFPMDPDGHACPRWN
ncbi:MAG: hypothetical protein KatS3mg009_0641 [Acidimicrobiia bacterium]|nr:MAG: hypothetical protein KatS3mg009_0641 [Acidimicrobiia bacterium]